MKELEIKYVNINDIKPNEYNPKKMSKGEMKSLRDSIQKFGIVDPLIVNEAKNRRGVLIGGHQRYKIYNDLHYKKVAVVWVDIGDLK